MAGDYPEVLIAILLFPINILIIGLIFTYQVHYISKSGHLCDPGADKNLLQLYLVRSMMNPKPHAHKIHYPLRPIGIGFHHAHSHTISHT
ncbi:MAG: hypothetical protein ABSE07_05420 [Methanoregula sp.]